jgi:phosphopantetheinyl transferase
VLEIRKINVKITIGLLDLKAFSEKEGLTAKRELERAGTLYLLSQLLNNEPFELHYTPERKPLLKNRSEHISISHSKDKLAIIVNTEQNTGIDIEQMRDKVIAIKHKFLNTHELAFAGDDVSRLLTYWAAKEAMYKVYGLKELEFIKHLFVEDFYGSEVYGRIEHGELKKRYRLFSEETEGYKLVYVVDEL